LVAPLDWGLGHTTRCVPLIKWLLVHDIAVIFAGNEGQRLFIENILPGIETIHLDGYGIRYSSNPGHLRGVLIRQAPHIPGATRREHKWLAHFALESGIDGVISYNRYCLLRGHIEGPQYDSGNNVAFFRGPLPNFRLFP